MNHSVFRFLSILVFASLCALSNPSYAQHWTTVTTSDGSAPEQRHEANAIVYNGLAYLFGGRGERPVETYDPTTNVWKTIATAPVEMHHFQPVLHNNKIYILGAFTCCYPTEPTIEDIHVFDPADNSWSIAGSIPSDRLRGAAGALSHNNKIYLIGGNTNGHDGGAVGWFDEYDPETGNWTTLPDAPTARDHFAAVLIDNAIIATGGRQSARSFAFTVASTDIYDFNTNQWTRGSNIPTQRAGTMAVVYEDTAIIIGGESTAGAHSSVEVYNPANQDWSVLPGMIDPRHAGGAVFLGDGLHVFTGSTTKGGAGETNLHEVIDLSRATNSTTSALDTDNDGLSDDDELNVYFTDSTLPDTDGDGINDYDEIYTTGTNPNSADSDNDNIDDQDEIDRNLDPNKPDTDDDNLTDGDEVSVYFTAPDNNDTDGDGVSDGAEVNTYETNPLQQDSDSDSLADGVEITLIGSNPLSKDTDDDGLSDAVEFNEHGTSPLTNDSDADGLTDADELYVYATSPISNDSDRDGIPDGKEVLYYKSNPNAMDSDLDGVSDGQEAASGSSLTNIDEDNDGLENRRDGLEDSDGDGLPNFVDRDSDNDGIPDLVEIGFTDVNFDGQLDTSADWEASESIGVFTIPTPTSIALDTDGDGIPDYIDLDSDQDGIPDLAEASSNFSTSSVTIPNQTDNNRDGLTDNYQLNMVAPANDDDDSVPNHLDLDSDNDGTSDLVETGSPDVDNNDLIDNYIDADGDGLADYGRPALAQGLPDTDNDSLPDHIDSEHTRNNGLLGCTFSTHSAADPLFITLLLLSIGGLMRNRRKAKADLKTN